MGKRIIVAGAGHGGLAAAHILAKNGYDVTVYERCAENQLGYEWSDYFEVKSLSAAGFPLPKEGIVDKIPIAFYGPDANDEPVCQRDQPGEFDMYMDRRDLYAHLIKCCKKAGVRFCFESEVKEPIVLGSRVAGIRTDAGDFYADLIIDAAGMQSPVRLQLPPYLMMGGRFGLYDVLHTYRGIYNRVKDAPAPSHNYKVYLSDDGNVGLKWCVTYPDYVDVLIARFHPIKDGEIESVYEDLKKDNPQLGDELLRAGQVCDIPVRQSPPVLVADGYAAIGDCVAMTMPIMGSGISASFKAGAFLAKAVMDDVHGEYTMETLWQYEVDYMKKVGFDFCSLALVKAVLPRLKQEEVDFFYKEKILTSDDLTFGTENSSLLSLFSNFTIGSFVERVKKATANPVLLKKISAIAKQFVKLKSVTSTFPAKFNRASVLRWAEKYNEFFDGIIDRSI